MGREARSTILGFALVLVLLLVVMVGLYAYNPYAFGIESPPRSSGIYANLSPEIVDDHTLIKYTFTGITKAAPVADVGIMLRTNQTQYGAPKNLTSTVGTIQAGSGECFQIYLADYSENGLIDVGDSIFLESNGERLAPGVYTLAIIYRPAAEFVCQATATVT